ncbi:hypothetical protein CR513_56388, partial [Mucuna pruriens]
MACKDTQKVTIFAFMLAEESNRLGEFQEIFLKEVLLEDICNYKPIEFLKPKQGTKIVANYAIKLKNY